MESADATRSEIEPHTQSGKWLVELAENLGEWCEAETNITHRQARTAIGLAAIGGAAVIFGWDNYWYHTLNNTSLFAEGKPVPQYYNWPDLVGTVKKMVAGEVTGEVDVPGGGFGGFGRGVDVTINLSPDQRREAIEGLLKVEGRQAAKEFTAKLAFLAGVGITALGHFMGSNEKIKGSTGAGQLAGKVIKSIGQVL